MFGKLFGNKEGLKIAREEHFELRNVPEGLSDYEVMFENAQREFESAKQESGRETVIKKIAEVVSSLDATFFESGIGIRYHRLEDAKKDFLKRKEKTNEGDTTIDHQLSIIQNDIAELEATEEFLTFVRLTEEMIAYKKSLDFQEAA